MPKIRPHTLKLNLDITLEVKDKLSQEDEDKKKLKASLAEHQIMLEEQQWRCSAEINDENQRYKDITTPRETVITAPDRTNFPANHISLGTSKGVIRCQYPTENAVPSFLDMLAEKRATVLVVIGEDRILDYPLNKKPYPIYFKNTKDSHNDMESLAEFKGVPLPSNTPVECFKLKLENKQDINDTGKPIGIPVIHVNQWPDKTSLPVNDLEELARYVNTVSSNKYSIYKNRGSRAVGLPQKALPVIHCSAGVGRTGQLIAAMELTNKKSTLSLESIIRTLREQGNSNMVQTEEQMDVLIDLAKMLEKPLWIKDEQ